MSPDKLIYMANQIGTAFNHQSDQDAIASVAQHIKLYWDPRMRAQILEHEKAGGSGLKPRVLAAIKSLHP